jgi:flagellar hook-basal body complex protein FliE
MINFNTKYPTPPTSNTITPKAGTEHPASGKFEEAAKNVGKIVSQVDDLQQASDVSIKDLLSGQNNDITAVVSSVAKADMSFKLLVGVRNKLIEAYKQTMNMQI